VTQKQIVGIVGVCIIAMLVLMALSLAGKAGAQGKASGFNDAVISQMVRRAINNDAALRTMDITVEVQDRVVHLGGFVNSLADMEKVESLARKVEGVSQVRSSLRVTNRPSRA
jgi:osmotically-inducible protein OsmY